MSDDDPSLEDAHVRSNMVRPWKWSLSRLLRRLWSDDESEEDASDE